MNFAVERVSFAFYKDLGDAFKAIPVPLLSLAFSQFVPVSVVFRKRRYFAYVDCRAMDDFVCFSFFRVRRDGTVSLIRIK